MLTVYVLTRDAAHHSTDMEPIGVFNNIPDAQAAAQTLEPNPIRWEDYNNVDVGGWIDDNWYVHYVITEVPMNGIKATTK